MMREELEDEMKTLSYSLFCVRDSFVVPDDRVLMEILTRVKPQANALLPATHTAREHVRLQRIRLPWRIP